jgi:hypothetical protein
MMGMKLKMMISHLPTGTELGTAFIININYIQLLAGIGTPIFTTQADISYIPMNWLLHIHQFLLEINATLEIQDLWSPARQCQHDEFLMTAFITMKASPSELVALNNWRLYYRVLLRLEVCFATGKGIQPYYLQYEHAELPKQSKTNLSWLE